MELFLIFFVYIIGTKISRSFQLWKEGFAVFIANSIIIRGIAIKQTWFRWGSDPIRTLVALISSLSPASSRLKMHKSAATSEIKRRGKSTGHSLIIITAFNHKI